MILITWKGIPRIVLLFHKLIYFVHNCMILLYKYLITPLSIWQTKSFYSNLSTNRFCNQHTILVWNHRWKIFHFILTFTFIHFFDWFDGFQVYLLFLVQENQKLFHGHSFHLFAVLPMDGLTLILELEMFTAGLRI